MRVGLMVVSFLNKRFASQNNLLKAALLKPGLIPREISESPSSASALVNLIDTEGKGLVLRDELWNSSDSARTRSLKTHSLVSFFS